MKLKAWHAVAARADRFFLRESPEEIRDNDELVAAAVGSFGGALEFASSRLQGTKQIVISAVQNDCRALQYADEAMKDDLDVVMAAVNAQIGYASANGQSHFEIAAHCGHDEMFGGFACASPRIRDMADVVLTVVTGVGSTLKNASYRLQNDREIVLAAVRNTGSALRFASPKLKSDPEVVQAALAQSALAIEFVPDEVLTLEMVLAAVKSCPRMLSEIASRWQENKQVVCAAVSVDGCALEHATTSLKDDLEVVHLAVENTPLAYHFAGTKARKSPELLHSAVVGGLLLPEKHFKDEDLVCILLENIRKFQSSEPNERLGEIMNVQDWYSGDWLKKILKLHSSSKRVAEAAMRCSGNSSIDNYFLMFDVAIREDKEFCIAAVKAEPYLYSLLSEHLQSDKDVIQAYAESGSGELDEVPSACQDDAEIVIMFAGFSPSRLRSIPEKFRSLPGVIVAMASNSFDGSDLTDQEVLTLAQDDAAIKTLLNANPKLFFLREGLQGDRSTLLAAAELIGHVDPWEILSSLACDRALLDALPFVPENLCAEIGDDPKFIRDGVARGAQWYGDLSEKWKKDRNVCEAFIERSANTHDCHIDLLPKAMREDRELMLLAVNRGCLPDLEVLPKRIREDDSILEAFYLRMEHEDFLVGEEPVDR